MSLVLRAAAVTDIGLSRMNNEDSAYAGSFLAVVADGIGGMPAGELASAVVVRELASLDRTGSMAEPLHGSEAATTALPTMALPTVSEPTGEHPTVRAVDG